MLTRDLVVVRADTMKLRVTVEEHAELQERIRAVLNTWDHGTRREGSLIDISVIVFGILGDVEFAELLELHYHKATTSAHVQRQRGLRADCRRASVQ